MVETTPFELLVAYQLYIAIFVSDLLDRKAVKCRIHMFNYVKMWTVDDPALGKRCGLWETRGVDLTVTPHKLFERLRALYRNNM